MTYKLTEFADLDLFNMYLEGLEKFGLRQADLYYERIKQAFVTISDNPEIARERKEVRPPVRIHPCEAHVIVYEIDMKNVTILRIRHHRENWLEGPI